MTSPEASTRLHVVPTSGAGELHGEKPPLVPPGRYLLRFSHWETAIIWGRSHKLILHFTICDVGPYFGTTLRRYYNVTKVVGRPGKHGNFKIGWKHDLVREYARLLPLPSRADRLNLDRLSSILIVGQVDTTKTSARQKDIPEALHYSVVRELLKVEAGAR